MTYASIAPPVAEPLALGDIKAHLRIDGTGEDDLLTGLVRVAREQLERATGLSLVSQGWRFYLDGWPATGVVEISRGPVLSVDAVRAFDEAGVETVLPLAGHVLDGGGRPARLWLRERPSTRAALNGIEVDFTAGFGESGADVPDGLKRAMLVHAAQMYEFRGAVPLEMQPAVMPDGYDRLIAPYLMRRL